MKTKSLLFILVIIFTAFSCNKKKIKENLNIFPEEINKNKKISEKMEKNEKKLSLLQEYNENNSMIEFVKTKYTKNLTINRYKYKSSLYAFSEFSMSKDNNYSSFKKSEYAYQLGNDVVLLSKNYIYKISLAICDLDKLDIKPTTDIKIPKDKLDSTINSEKLFINEDEVFPFFHSYIKRDIQYKNIIISTIEQFKLDKTTIKKLEDFIKKQSIIEDTDKYIIFKIEDNESLYLWQKKKNILFLNFSETDLEKIKEI